MNKPLYDYLENARRLENDIYACDATIDKLNKNINELNDKVEDAERRRNYNYYWPKLPDKEPLSIKKPENPDNSFAKIICAVIGFSIYSLFSMLMFVGDYPLQNGMPYLGAVLGIVVGIKIYKIHTKRAKEKYEKNLDEYKKSEQKRDEEHSKKRDKILHDYWEKLDEECLRYQNRINSYKNRIVDIKNQRAQIQAVLDQYYSVNIVYPKYRALIPITMFCEYIDSGRCVTLEGHEGAYNIYENELRQNVIISKLDGISSRLDSIKSSQYLLYNAITDANNISNQLVSNFSRYTDQQSQANAMQLISNRAVVDSNNALKDLAEKNLEELKKLSK